MKDINIKELCKILSLSLNKNKFDEDKTKIDFLFNELSKIKTKLITLNELEEIKEVVYDLDIKYDEFCDLAYYFDPLYVEIKNVIHNREVKKLREENRKKRNMI